MDASTTAAAPPGLIVFVGGLKDDLHAIDPLMAKLLELPELAGYQHFVYPRRIRPWSRGRLADRAHDLATEISNFWDTQGHAPNVILMGHSIGGLMVRQAYLEAAGGFRKPAQPWAARVSRIVLFAAPNLGVDIKRYPWPLRLFLSLLFSVSHRWTGADAITGAPFLANLRLEWMRTVPKMAPPPVVIQVRGTDDRGVLASDSLDLEAMPNSTNVEIYGADHASIILPSNPNEQVPGTQLQLLTQAVVGTFPPAELEAKARKTVTSVVFLLHGIRAGIFGWVRNLADVIKGKVPTDTVYVEQMSYGYLSAWKFMLPWGHDRQLRKFADWYTEMRSTYGEVDFHFVGHSNGTYILGRSLERIPAMRFQKVYLAGSVLPTDFDWTKYRQQDQVCELVNACGSKDVPVGVLCKALHALGRSGLGTGGYDGFDDSSLPGTQFLRLRDGDNVKPGDHGAGLVDERLPAVADYVLASTIPDGALWTKGASPRGFALLSKFAGLFALFLTGIIVAAVVVLFMWTLVAGLIAIGAIVLVLLILSAI